MLQSIVVFLFSPQNDTESVVCIVLTRSEFYSPSIATLRHGQFALFFKTIPREDEIRRISWFDGKSFAISAFSD